MLKHKLFSILIIAAVVATIVGSVGFTVWSQWNTYEVTGTVKSIRLTQISNNVEDGMTYIVRLENGRLLELGPISIFHAVNTDIVLTEIEENTTYTFVCWGFEYTFPLANIYWYPNIIEANGMT
jgi:hypothetical protein